MFRYLILLILLFSTLAAMAQDTVTTQAPVQNDTSTRSLKIPQPVSMRDSTPLSTDTVMAPADTTSPKFSPIKKPINSFKQELFPSVYGPYVGGFMKADERFNVTAPVLRVPELLRRVNGREWIFYLFCGILLLFSLIRLTFLKYFGNLFSIFFNTSLRHKQITEQLSQSPLPSLLLNIFFFVTGGIFLYFIIQHYGIDLGMPVGLALLSCIAGVAALYGGKFLFITLLGWIFDRRIAAENYLFVVFMVNKVAGLVLLPASILMAYLGSDGKDVMITLVIIIMVILFIMRLFRGFQSVSKILKINLLHFLLYVAAFEVIPVLLIYKVLLAVIG